MGCITPILSAFVLPRIVDVLRNISALLWTYVALRTPFKVHSVVYDIDFLESLPSDFTHAAIAVHIQICGSIVLWNGH